MESVEEREIVIVGAGICGLATALALHRKGIKSVVLERSDSLREEGAAIRILNNGWIALEELGRDIAARLRKLTVRVNRADIYLVDKRINQEVPHNRGEDRVLKRSDLINALAEALPSGTIRFECSVESIELDPETSLSIVHLEGGKSIHTKILIGCDGARSTVAKFLDLSPVNKYGLSAMRGVTYYPNGHSFLPSFVQMQKRDFFVGSLPMDDKNMYWFLCKQSSPDDEYVAKDPELIRKKTLELMSNFPTETKEMVKNSSTEHLSLYQLRYRAPWDLYTAKFRKGTVVVAGDAMHIMGPFLGQGGSAGMEDAIVLARCLSEELLGEDNGDSALKMKKVGEAMDRYIEERRMRIVKLSTQTYLYGLLFRNAAGSFSKFFVSLMMSVLFRNPTGHVQYDCGRL